MANLLCCLTTVSLAVFFGIFFGINYPEIKKSEYIPTICHSLSSTIVSRFCCYLKCDYDTCSDKNIEGLPKCKLLLSQSQSLSPIECSKNSSLCPKAGSNAYCNNGYFCSNNGPCGNQMVCDQCYNVEMNLTYYVGLHRQNIIHEEDFSKSLDNANVFLSAHDQIAHSGVIIIRHQ